MILQYVAELQIRLNVKMMWLIIYGILENREIQVSTCVD
jgi:hypothetical protein